MALKRYLYVVGVNSSVLFEALSMGKIVARLNFNGFCPIPTHIEEDGFYYVSCLVDFQKFINSKIMVALQASIMILIPTSLILFVDYEIFDNSRCRRNGAYNV